MSYRRLALFGLCFGLGSAARADWKPVPGPLTTRWTKDVTPETAHPEYPRPQLVREDWLNLNGLWQLEIAKEGDALPLGRTLPEQILVPFPVESALSGVQKRADHLWYRRLFRVPQGWAGRRVLLHFGAVDWEATVWVNGQDLGTHRGGYDAFSFDVTDALKGQGDQEVIVRVFDPTDAGTQPRGKQVRKPGGIMYTPTTGIWQTVWLEPVPVASIRRLKVTPDLDRNQVDLSVETSGDPAGLTLSFTAFDGDKSVSGGSGQVDASHLLLPPKAKLWSPDHPFLYDLKVELRKGDQVVDSVRSYFGLRKVEVGPDDKGVTRILLNGKPLFQVGPLDQGFWPDGIYTAPTDVALRYDVEVTRTLGFNMTRKHVKVEPDRWYYWCDKLGLLVWQDMPGSGAGNGEKDTRVSDEAAQQFERELGAMIDGRINHPSIIMWVVFNEGWGQYDTARLTNWVKTHDPTRLVDCASGWTDRNVGDVHDIHAYPGPASPGPESRRAVVLGEFGGLGLGVKGHTWSDLTWGYKGASGQEDLTRKYETLLKNVWALKEEGGLCAAVYTQISDVETEGNGLLTYDRAVIKVDPDRASAANRGDFSKARIVEVVEEVPTSRKQAVTWRYTTDPPAERWSRPNFDDSAWNEGPGGFGTRSTPGSTVRTEWATQNIWLRREFTLPAVDPAQLVLLAHHDEDVEVYLNGVLAARADGYTTEYEDMAISSEARAALKPGKNVLAVHCKQTYGGQYIDVGLAVVKERRP